MATLKQKAVLSELSENVGMPIGEAMRKSGYSESTSETPQRLTESKGWKELLEEKLPDSLLAKKHLELLNKKEYIAIGKKGEREVVSTNEIDGISVAKGLDMAYKLKNKYPATRISITDPLDDMSDEELEGKIIELQETVKKRQHTQNTAIEKP